MLGFYTRLAGWLHPWRGALVVLAVLGAVAFGIVVATYTGPRQESYMLLAAVAALWALSAAILAQTFVQPPPVLEPGDRFGQRLGKRILRGLYWLMAVVVTVLLAAVLYLTLKAAGLAVTELGT